MTTPRRSKRLREKGFPNNQDEEVRDYDVDSDESNSDTETMSLASSEEQYSDSSEDEAADPLPLASTPKVLEEQVAHKASNDKLSSWQRILLGSTTKSIIVSVVLYVWLLVTVAVVSHMLLSPPSMRFTWSQVHERLLGAMDAGYIHAMNALSLVWIDSPFVMVSVLGLCVATALYGSVYLGIALLGLSALMFYIHTVSQIGFQAL